VPKKGGVVLASLEERNRGRRQVVYHEVGTEREEAEVVAEAVAQGIRSGRGPLDYGIVCPDVEQSAGEYGRALTARSLPFRVVGGRPLHRVEAETLALVRLTLGLNTPDLELVLRRRVAAEELAAFLAAGGGPASVQAALQDVQRWLERYRGKWVRELVQQALVFLGHLPGAPERPHQTGRARGGADGSAGDDARVAQDLLRRAAAADSLAHVLAWAGGSVPPGVPAVTIAPLEQVLNEPRPHLFLTGLVEGRWTLDPAHVLAAVDRPGVAVHLSRARTYERRAYPPAPFLAELDLITPGHARPGANREKATPPDREPPGKPPASSMGPEAIVPLVKLEAGPTPFTGDESLQLSATALETYRECPRKYYYAKVLELPEEDSVYFAFGEALHGVLEQFNRSRMAGAPMDWAEVAVAWAGALEAGRFGSVAEFEAYRERGHVYLRRYHGWAVQRAERVLGVEQEFAIPYTDRAGRTHALRGRFDLIVQSATGLEIVDYKSGHRGGTTRVNKRPTGTSENDPERKLQLGLYYLAHVGEQPVPGARVTYIFLRHPADRPESYVDEFNHKGEQVISAEHTAESLRGIREMVNDAIDGILNNDFTRKPDPWKCRNCPFRHPCAGAGVRWV
jgi:RecB family exonuclease